MAWNRAKYTRSLIGMIIIVMALSYYFSTHSWNFFIVLGGILLLEHYLIWERWNFYDYIIGHEWWGIYLTVIPLWILGGYMTAFYVIIGFLIGADYTKFNTWKSFKYTIKELFQEVK